MGPINRAALDELKKNYPDIIGLICSAHESSCLKNSFFEDNAESLLKDHQVFQKQIKGTRNHSKQPTLPPVTRFCYALQTLSDAIIPFRIIARSSITEDTGRTPIQIEWMKYINDSTGSEQKNSCNSITLE